VGPEFWMSCRGWESGHCGNAVFQKEGRRSLTVSAEQLAVQPWGYSGGISRILGR
jgi:hypothetical protein